MKVYKVVSKNSSGQLVSFCWRYLLLTNTVVYKPGQWVSAGVGPLFAFATLHEAAFLMLSAEEEPTEEIWLAEAEVSKQPTPRLILGLQALYEGKAKAFWQYVLKGKTTKGKTLCRMGEANIPHGTVFCDKIKLIKRIDRGER